MNKFTQLEVRTEDDKIIIGRMFVPQGEPIAAVLIVSAMGVKQQYYASFASWLSEQGYLVATFDYRGIGLSHMGSLRGYHADIMDWAQLDCAAMVKTVAAAVDRKPLYWLGHSLGGQIFPFLPEWLLGGCSATTTTDFLVSMVSGGSFGIAIVWLFSG